MKYVYVLVSSKNDLYYEQALMSVHSLRLYMPKANVVILVDNKTYDSFNDSRTQLSKLATSVISVSFEDSVKNIERSRLIKTSIPDYIDDDFLYIDCDTIICSDLSEIEDNTKYPMELGGILDGHVILDEHIHKKYFLQRDKKLGFKGTIASNCNINGGIILARKSNSSKELFKTWNEVWKYSAYIKHDMHDQSALNEANYRIGLKIEHLSGEWNCQPSHGGLAFLQNAKIIHYYSSEFSGKNYIPYYKLADRQLQEQIKKTGIISEEISLMIKNPKFQFNKVHLVNDSRIVKIMQSPLVFTLADIQEKLPLLFNIMENTMSFIRNFGKKLKIKK